jgi:homoserine kinase
VSATIRVRAPASSANLGPGFDCAACALDLWNELEVGPGEGVDVAGEGADELPRGPEHLSMRAFALLAPLDGRRFRAINRIPLARGLGSSAAAIALGLVAGAEAAGRRLTPEELLAVGVGLEGHPDNLAAALTGGVCLTWAQGGSHRVVRVAESLPLVPLALVPSARVETAAARASLPATISHADAAFSAGRAALLGAGLASGDASLLAAAFADRLHEPFRAAAAPLLGAVRDRLPSGAVGATLSGSGPTVIVWAEPGRAAACAAELASRFSDERVLSLGVADAGAGPVVEHSGT